MDTVTFSKLSRVFREVFDDDDLTLDRSTSAATVDGWDSLRHVVLLLNIEKAFGIKFSSAQVASLKNVGELVDLIDRLTAGKTNG